MKKCFAYWILFILNTGLSQNSAVDFQYPVSYEGSQVWRTALRSTEDMGLFNKLVANEDISVWKYGEFFIDYLVHGKDIIRVHRVLEDTSLEHKVLIPNVQSKIEATKVERPHWTDSSLRIGHRLNWRYYPSLEVIEEYFDFLKANFEALATISVIGTTAENRTIKMIKISNGNPSNKGILITAGQHAREWVSITSALYIANSIISQFDEQPDYVKDKNWYIIPVLNPDGFKYSQTSDRLWRKNRSSNKFGDVCKGVDINRNFQKFWALAGITTHNSCEEDYAGPAPFSEAESKALRNLLDKFSKKPPSAYIDLHAYGQMIMYPWAGDNGASAYKSDLEFTADEMRTAIYNLTKKRYTMGSPGVLLYLASGVAIDWVHSKGIPLCYAIESRDTGMHGFLLPASQIEATAKELLTAVETLAKNLSPVQVMTRAIERQLNLLGFNSFRSLG